MDELDRMKQIMDVCKIMDNAIMAGAGPLGYDPEISLEDNVGHYKEVYSPIADLAENEELRWHLRIGQEIVAWVPSVTALAWQLHQKLGD